MPLVFINITPSNIHLQLCFYMVLKSASKLDVYFLCENAVFWFVLLSWNVKGSEKADNVNVNKSSLQSIDLNDSL